VLELPLVVLLHQHSPDEADDAVFVREDSDDVGAALDLLVSVVRTFGTTRGVD
jgi:hypothetical protein